MEAGGATLLDDGCVAYLNGAEVGRAGIDSAAGTDVPPKPGELNAHCSQNSECQSGFCIEGPEGFVCTIECLAECPNGWLCRTLAVGSDLQSLCFPAGANLCRACAGFLRAPLEADELDLLKENIGAI